MDVYFIRHGESTDNRDGNIPQDSAALSSKGVLEAEAAGMYMKLTSVDKIYYGTSRRAHDTAFILQRALGGVAMSQDRIFDERKLPTSVIGALHSEVSVLETFKAIARNGCNMSWRHSDEETFYELRERVQDTLRRISNSDLRTIVVVSHAGIMKMLTCLLWYGADATHEQCMRIDTDYTIRSSGILHLSQSAHAWRAEMPEGFNFLQLRAD